MRSKWIFGFLLIGIIQLTLLAEEGPRTVESGRPTFGQPGAGVAVEKPKEESVEELIAQLQEIVKKLRAKGLSDQQIVQLAAGRKPTAPLADRSGMIEAMKAKGMSEEQIRDYFAKQKSRQASGWGRTYSREEMIRGMRAKGMSDEQIKEYLRRAEAKKRGD